MRNGNKLMPSRILSFSKILIINRLRFQTVRDELLGDATPRELAASDGKVTVNDIPEVPVAFLFPD